MIRGELAIRRGQRATNLYSVGRVLAQTMMQLCASATKLRGGGPILQGGAKGPCADAGCRHLGLSSAVC